MLNPISISLSCPCMCCTYSQRVSIVLSNIILLPWRPFAYFQYCANAMRLVAKMRDLDMHPCRCRLQMLGSVSLRASECIDAATVGDRWLLRGDTVVDSYSTGLCFPTSPTREPLLSRTGHLSPVASHCRNHRRDGWRDMAMSALRPRVVGLDHRNRSKS